jgi:gliding motility-associated-like protein
VVPNAFTPNGDLQNDVFLPKAAGLVKLEEFSVFNRWGEKVFSSSDILQGWDGKYKNIPQEIGTYIYYIKGLMADQTIKVFKGNFMLIR